MLFRDGTDNNLRFNDEIVFSLVKNNGFDLRWTPTSLINSRVRAWLSRALIMKIVENIEEKGGNISLN